MQIFDHPPADWKDLQNLVGQLFSELGCGVTVGAKVELVRGFKEIDVLVEDKVTTPGSIYAIECKNWGRKVPQETVHSFRSVVSDMGAHQGFIVSKAGFQSGAFGAAEKTNIKLLNFDQLQDLFADRWREAIARKYMPLAESLFPYWAYFGGRRPPSHWGDAERESLVNISSAYGPIIDIGPTMQFNNYKLEFPISVSVLNDDMVPVGALEISTYRQYYDFVEKNKGIALDRYEKLFAERSA